MTSSPRLPLNDRWANLLNTDNSAYFPYHCINISLNVESRKHISHFNEYVVFSTQSLLVFMPHYAKTGRDALFFTSRAAQYSKMHLCLYFSLVHLKASSQQSPTQVKATNRNILRRLQRHLLRNYSSFLC